MQPETEKINRLIGTGQYADAYMYLVEEWESLPQRHLYCLCVDACLHGGVKALLIWALTALLFSFSIGPFDLKQLVSVLAIFSGVFLHANYVSGFIGVALGFFFGFGLLRQLFITVLFPARLSQREGRAVPAKRKCVAALLSLLAAVSMTVSLGRAIPYLRDLPMALRGECSAVEITSEETAGKDMGDLMRTPSYLYEHRIMGSDAEDYNGQTWKHEYTKLGFPGINSRVFHVTIDGVVYVLNEIEESNLLYTEDCGRYLVQYMPHSKRILQIRNWGGGG